MRLSMVHAEHLHLCIMGLKPGSLPASDHLYAACELPNTDQRAAARARSWARSWPAPPWGHSRLTSPQWPTTADVGRWSSLWPACLDTSADTCARPRVIRRPCPHSTLRRAPVCAGNQGKARDRPARSVVQITFLQMKRRYATWHVICFYWKHKSQTWHAA